MYLSYPLPTRQVNTVVTNAVCRSLDDLYPATGFGSYEAFAALV
jgi:hypothetical protein